MSVYVIHYKDGAKMMRPVLTRDEYIALRNSNKQVSLLASVRKGKTPLKMMLLQMNYSCLPNEDGSLKGSTRMSTTIGMDVDHIAPSDLERVKETILEKKDELGLLMLELSARGEGYHLVFKRKPELTQEENLKWASDLLGVEYDKGAKDITRVFFTTSASKEDLIYLDDEVFEVEESTAPSQPSQGKAFNSSPSGNRPLVAERLGRALLDGGQKTEGGCQPRGDLEGASSRIRFIAQGVMKEKGLEKSDFLCEGGRHTSVKIFLSGVTQLLTKPETNAILAELMPEHWNDENIQTLVNDFYLNYAKPNQRLMKYQEQLFTQSQRIAEGKGDTEEVLEAQDEPLYYERLPKMPMGVRESIEAVGPSLSMPTLTAICPCIGALATGVKLDVHGTKNSLNLISYIAGDFASGKGNIDPVIEAWTSEVKAVDRAYLEQESEWRRKKRAAKNKEEQPEEPKLPVRILTLNNTVANLAERLANTDGKHAFSFTPEADTVAQKWKTSMSDFSVMLRQSYDGSSYEREARSADAVNVHIDRLLWNVTMCGTPDALYRVVSNYTDGFQSRLAVARTPDNTFSPLEEKPYVITEEQKNRIAEVAHLLMLMNGTVELPKLEQKGREWLEQIRQETMMNDDKVRARQRFRICVTTQRMICCMMLCKVAEELIEKYGFEGAEKEMKSKPDLWKEMLVEVQTPQALAAYDVVADYLLDCALFFFRERIEFAFNSREYAGTQERRRTGKNDSIFECLDFEFNFDSAFQYSAMMKKGSVSRNQVQQMLKNWKRQGLIVQTESGFRKVQDAMSLSH